MTKVQVRFRLQSPLKSGQLARLAGAHAIYGLDRLRADPSGEYLSVDYDASRLTRPDVEANLRKLGISAARED